MPSKILRKSCSKVKVREAKKLLEISTNALERIIVDANDALAQQKTRIDSSIRHLKKLYKLLDTLIKEVERCQKSNGKK